MPARRVCQSLVPIDIINDPFQNPIDRSKTSEVAADEAGHDLVRSRNEARWDNFQHGSPKLCVCLPLPPDAFPESQEPAAFKVLIDVEGRRYSGRAVVRKGWNVCFRSCKLTEFSKGCVYSLIPVVENVSILRAFVIRVLPEVVVDSIDCLEGHHKYVRFVPLNQKLGGLDTFCMKPFDLCKEFILSAF